MEAHYTLSFLHGSLLHIVFNMWVLMDLSPIIEDLYGSARFLFIFVVTGVCGYVLSAATGHFSVGASGSLLGLVGLLLALTSGRQNSAMRMLRSQLLYWLAYIAVIGFPDAGASTTTRTSAASSPGSCSEK